MWRNLTYFIFPNLKMHKHNLKIGVYHTLQDIFKMIVEGAMNHLVWSHVGDDVNKIESNVMWQDAVISLCSEKDR